jgi:hypothetical protein
MHCTRKNVPERSEQALVDPRSAADACVDPTQQALVVAFLFVGHCFFHNPCHALIQVVGWMPITTKRHTLALLDLSLSCLRSQSASPLACAPHTFGRFHGSFWFTPRAVRDRNNSVPTLTPVAHLHDMARWILTGPDMGVSLLVSPFFSNPYTPRDAFVRLCCVHHENNVCVDRPHREICCSSLSCPCTRFLDAK